jgi:hypothetical protein
MKTEEMIIQNFLSTVDILLPKYAFIISANDEAEKYKWSHQILKQVLDGLDDIYDNVDLQIKNI